MRVGRDRDEALRNLAERTGVDDLRSLVAMLIQTDKFGTSIARAIRAFSDSLRTKRRQRAEQAAQKAAVKLLFPLACFLFPDTVHRHSWPGSPPTHGYARQDVKELAMQQTKNNRHPDRIRTDHRWHRDVERYHPRTRRRSGRQRARGLGSDAGDVNENGEVTKKKGGNKVARIFAAPFKAFGKLFKGKDDKASAHDRE